MDPEGCDGNIFQFIIGLIWLFPVDLEVGIWSWVYGCICGCDWNWGIRLDWGFNFGNYNDCCCWGIFIELLLEFILFKDEFIFCNCCGCWPRVNDIWFPNEDFLFVGCRYQCIASFRDPKEGVVNIWF